VTHVISRSPSSTPPQHRILRRPQPQAAALPNTASTELRASWTAAGITPGRVFAASGVLPCGEELIGPEPNQATPDQDRKQCAVLLHLSSLEPSAARILDAKASEKCETLQCPLRRLGSLDPHVRVGYGPPQAGKLIFATPCKST
jgi:hypothetical protein